MRNLRKKLQQVDALAARAADARGDSGLDAQQRAKLAMQPLLAAALDSLAAGAPLAEVQALLGSAQAGARCLAPCFLLSDCRSWLVCLSYVSGMSGNLCFTGCTNFGQQRHVLVRWYVHVQVGTLAPRTARTPLCQRPRLWEAIWRRPRRVLCLQTPTLALPAAAGAGGARPRPARAAPLRAAQTMPGVMP